MQTIPVKILGSKRSQRYSIARAMIQAKAAFEKEHPEFELDITQVTTSQLDFIHLYIRRSANLRLKTGFFASSLMTFRTSDVIVTLQKYLSIRN